MATIQHPAFLTDVREIPDADAASWVEQGWIEVKPSSIAAEDLPVGVLAAEDLHPGVAETVGATAAGKPRGKK